MWLTIIALETYCVIFLSKFYFPLSPTDSEPEESVQEKNAKKQPEKLPLSPKPGKILRQHPVTYISETGKGAEYVECCREK